MKKLKDTGVQEINAKSLKGVSGFNKGDIMAPLLVEFYEITKRAMGNERQQNVIIRGYTLEDLAAVGDDNASSEKRSYSHAPIAVDYLIKHGLKEPSLIVYKR